MFILDEKFLDCRFAKTGRQRIFQQICIDSSSSPGDRDRVWEHNIVLQYIGKCSISIRALEWGCSELAGQLGAKPSRAKIEDLQSSRIPRSQESTNPLPKYARSP
jgi:hypothetical protein